MSETERIRATQSATGSSDGGNGAGQIAGTAAVDATACSCESNGAPGGAKASETKRIRLTRLTERGG